LKALHLHLGILVALGALCALATGAAIAQSGDPCAGKSNDRAVELLHKKVKSEGLYASWAKEQCLRYDLEECDRQKVDIAIRERHSPECGGDPNVAPVVDRFRVYKSSKKIQWYDAGSNEYVGFSKIHTIGGR
jgi:hypothetical protein